MATQIEKKVQLLRSQGFDLGLAQSGEVNCGYGGRMQTFTNATIYYHPVMGAEAREVHGGIRTKYLSLGGHDRHPAAGQRFFGFPLTDEKNSDDGRCRVSRFEWGAIYWLHGGAYLYGKIYQEYLRAGGERGRLGYPVSDPVTMSDGQAVFFEHGCMYMGSRSRDHVIEIRYSFPQMGLPWMIQPAQFSDQVVVQFNFYKMFMNSNIAGHLYAELFNGRLFLRETAGAVELPLMFRHEDTTDLHFSENIRIYQAAMRLQDPTAVKHRKLYDLVLRFPTRQHVLAPHAVYFRDHWRDFRFVHITDVHISRRVDRFRKFFSDRLMEDAVRNFNNFNDAFREFIHYANKLHRRGDLDFIIMTGDLVDYVFEDGGNTYHNNNFVYFEQIIRGLTGKPDKVQNVELTVPVFTSLGNHDYRVQSYYPLFTVDIQWPAGNKTIEQFGSFNLTRDEAKIVTEDLLGVRGMISTDRAIAMIRPDRENRGGNLNHYFRHICRKPSYLMTLGDHQVIMIDGKWDDGTIESTWDAISHYLGFRGEATDNFADGSPDSVGFTAQESEMVSKALQRSGLVIIGVHAPIINPKGGEYAWFLREYMRSASSVAFTREMQKYLFRRNPANFVTAVVGNQATVDLAKNVHTAWSRERSFYFHQGNGDDLLDYSIMRGNREHFMKMIAGVENSPRPADLILSGHVHKNFECRLFWEPSVAKFRIAHEFYTENPTVYYHSYDTILDPDGNFQVPSIGGSHVSYLKHFVKSRSRRLHVQVTEAAGINEPPIQGGSGVWSIRTKPYPLTLNAQRNQATCAWWWQQVRPLLVQTAALGPCEYQRAPERQPDFRGCRLITVQANTIQKINYVRNEEIKKIISTPDIPVINPIIPDFILR